ncbi:MAG TPA: ATP-binding protein [Caulobacteraceae bacterium]
MSSKRIQLGQPAQVLALGLVVFALAWLSIELSAPWRRLPPIWLPNAVTVAFLLRTRVRRWPALLAAAFLGNVTAEMVLADAPASVLGLSSANIVEVAVCVLGVKRLLKGRINVERPAQILIFGCIAAAASAIGATAGCLGLSAINHVPSTTNWLLWALGDLLGLILLTPFLASIQLSDLRRLQGPSHAGRATAVLAAIVADIALAAILPAHSLPLLAPPLMVFATLQLDFLGAAVSTLAVAVAFSVFVGRGWIPAAMTGRDFLSQLVAVQMFLLGTSLVTFPLAATLQRRKTLELELIASRDALVEANRLARMAEKLAGIGYWRIAPDEERFVWSEEMYRIYGRDPALGPPTIAESTFMVHPDDQALLARHRKQFNNSQAPELTVRVIRPSGEVRHVIVRSQIEQDMNGKVIARFGTLCDVTDLEQAQAASRHSEARYRFLAENAPDMISRASLTGEPLYASPGSVRLFGYTPEEMASLNAQDMVHPDDFERVMASIFSQIEERKSRLEEPLCYRAKRKDGRWIWIEANPTLVFDDNGEPIEFIDVIRDVTQAKTFEADLEEARRKAEAAAAAKSAFLANMSHELRTPLTSIIGFSRLLGDRDELAEESRRYARRIFDASEALLAIINDVLDFSKLDVGQAQLEIQPLSAPHLIEETTGIVAIQAAAKGLELRTELDPKTPELIGGDVARLRQVLLNFLSNAVKFTAEGAITVRTEWRGRKRSGRLRISVVDTGSGIAPESVGRLFERFSQAEVSINRTHGGSGLGLAISKGIVELMGGEVGVDTTLGEGSTFWFEIPAKAAAPMTTRAADAATPADCPSLRILMVDDTAVNRELVKLMLEPLGCEVEEAAGGADGVQAAMTRPYDLILMDVRMPGIDGLEATKLIRAVSAFNRRTPILALTADVQPDNAAACRSAGMDDIIAKPIVPRELVGKLMQWGSGRSAGAEEPVAISA